KTGFPRIAGTCGKVGYDAGYFLEVKRARYNIRTQWPQQADHPFASDGTGRNRNLAVQKFWVGRSAHMPQLHEYLAAAIMNRLSDFLPALDLGRAPDAGRAGMPHTLR